jgi:hypothetical protein
MHSYAMRIKKSRAWVGSYLDRGRMGEFCVVEGSLRRGWTRGASPSNFAMSVCRALVQAEESGNGEEDQGQGAGEGVGGAGGAGLGARSRAGGGWARGGSWGLLVRVISLGFRIKRDTYWEWT